MDKKSQRAMHHIHLCFVSVMTEKYAPFSILSTFEQLVIARKLNQINFLQSAPFSPFRSFSSVSSCCCWRWSFSKLKKMKKNGSLKVFSSKFMKDLAQIIQTSQKEFGIFHSRQISVFLRCMQPAHNLIISMGICCCDSSHKCKKKYFSLFIIRK